MSYAILRIELYVQLTFERDTHREVCMYVWIITNNGRREDNKETKLVLLGDAIIINENSQCLKKSCEGPL